MINVYIVSGPPGSGKSFQANGFARAMNYEGEKGEIFSADHYWSKTLRKAKGLCFSELESDEVIQGLKEYEFDLTQLPLAHQQCMKNFIDALVEAVEYDYNVSYIIDNTNIHSYEIAPYYLVGEAFGAKVEILRCENASVETCIRRNVHSVPEDVITRMYRTFNQTKEHPWEKDVMLPNQHMPWWASRTL